MIAIFLFIFVIVRVKSHDLDKYLLESSGNSMIDITNFHLDKNNKYEDVFPDKKDINDVNPGCFPHTQVYVDSEVISRAESQHNSFSSVLQGVMRVDSNKYYANRLCGNITLSSKLQRINDGVIVWRQNDYSFIHSPRTSLTLGSSRCSPNQPTPFPPTLTSHMRIIEEAVFDSSAVWAQAYYHSTSEKFFPLALARDILESNPNIIIIVEIIPDSLKEQLKLIGIDVSRLLVVDSVKTAVFVKKLYYPTWLFCGWTSPVIAQGMRNWIQAKNPEVYNTRAQKKTKIIVIDRRDRQNGGCSRCIVNTDEIVTAIKTTYPYFEVDLFLANPSQKLQLSQRDTMNLFSNATMIIAPHGAALTNFIYAPKGASMIEILNQDPMNPCFMVLARSLANDYYGISPISSQRVNVSKIIDVIKMILLNKE